MPITTTWTIPARPSSTTWTGRPEITSFLSYTWTDAPDNWATAVGNWSDYGTTTTGTQWTTNR